MRRESTYEIRVCMNRLLPGLVICGAIVAVGTGVVAFARTPRGGFGLWDLLFLTAVTFFLTAFIALVRAKAASTMSNHDRR